MRNKTLKLQRKKLLALRTSYILGGQSWVKSKNRVLAERQNPAEFISMQNTAVATLGITRSQRVSFHQQKIYQGIYQRYTKGYIRRSTEEVAKVWSGFFQRAEAIKLTKQKPLGEEPWELQMGLESFRGGDWSLSYPPLLQGALASLGRVGGWGSNPSPQQEATVGIQRNLDIPWRATPNYPTLQPLVTIIPLSASMSWLS